MSFMLKKHSSNPNIMTFSGGQQNYKVTSYQSRCSQLNSNQNIYSPRQDRYQPDYYRVGNQNMYKAQYCGQNNQRNKMRKQQFPTYQTDNYDNKFQRQSQQIYEPTFLKQKIIEVSTNRYSQNLDRENKGSIKTKLNRNVYLIKQNPQQRQNYFVAKPKSYVNCQVKQSTQMMSPVQLKKNPVYQEYSSMNNSKLQQLRNYKKYNHQDTQKKQKIQNFQYSNKQLQGFTFKNRQIFQKQKQTKHQSKVSTQQQYGLESMSNISKSIIPQSPRESEKSSHLMFQLKESIHNSTDDSGMLLNCLEQTRTLEQIKIYEKENELIKMENSRIEKEIEDKIQYQRQLLLKLNKMMKLFEDLKNKQLHKESNIKNMFEEQQNRQCQLEIYSVRSNQNKFIPKQQSRISLNDKQDSHLSTKASFGLANRSKKQYFPIINKNANPINQEIQIQSPKKLRIAVDNDTILQYSPIDQSVFSPKKPFIYDFLSNQTLKDQIFQSHQKGNKETAQKSRKQLTDVSMSGFESRFVPRQNNETKLKELQEIFQRQIKRCYSPKIQSTKSFKEDVHNQKKEKKEKLIRLSQQIKQLRNVVDRQNSSPNLNMLIFSNTSLK